MDASSPLVANIARAGWFPVGLFPAGLSLVPLDGGLAPGAVAGSRFELGVAACRVFPHAHLQFAAAQKLVVAP